MHEISTSEPVMRRNINHGGGEAESSKKEQDSLCCLSLLPWLAEQIWQQRTPAGKVLDKGPSCPCCGNQAYRVLGLTDLLIRCHGRFCFNVQNVGKQLENITVSPPISYNVKGLLKWLPLESGLVRCVGKAVKQKLLWANIKI